MNDTQADGPERRLALSPNEAADALGVSRDFLDKHVLPQLRVAHVGRRRLIPLTELQAWLHKTAARPARQPTDRTAP